MPDTLQIPSFDHVAHKNFWRRKRADAMSREASAASLQTLSSRSARVVHEYSDMDEMPISQWFFESVSERTHRARSRATMRVATSSRRVVATCRDAEGANRYTFR
jgi:hypothetical protein